MRLLVAEILDSRGDRSKADLLGGTPAPLAEDDLEPVALRPHFDGHLDAVGSDGLDERCEVDVGAPVLGRGVDRVDRDHGDGQGFVDERCFAVSAGVFFAGAGIEWLPVMRRHRAAAPSRGGTVPGSPSDAFTMGS